MEKILVKCSIKKNVIYKLLAITSIVIVVPMILFLFINIVASSILSAMLIVVIYLLLSLDKYVITDEGVYVYSKRDKIIYGYKHQDIEYIDLTKYGDKVGVKIVNSKYKSKGLLVVRDKTRIIIPEYVDNFEIALNILNKYHPGGMSSELKEYICSKSNLLQQH